MVKNTKTLTHKRGEDEMKHTVKKPTSDRKYKQSINCPDELFERCLQKGLIVKTDYGYYFTPEFFETLDIYDE